MEMITNFPRSRFFNKNYETFHEALGPILAFAQFFSQMPVVGITSKDLYKIKFKWSSFRTIYSLVFMTCGALECVAIVVRMCRKGTNVIYMEIFIFYTICTIQSGMLFRLARHWPNIVKFWNDCERPFLQFPYKMKGMKLKTKCTIIASVFFLLFCIDHLLVLTMTLKDNEFQLENCETSIKEFTKNYIRRQKPHFLYYIPYHFLEIFIYEWIQIQEAFNWSFTYLLISLISVCLTKRFEQFNERVRLTLDHRNWSEIREHYTKLCNLVQYVDEHISLLILVSLGHNVFLIIVCILESFRPESPRALNRYYFWYHLGYVVGKTTAVLFFASSVNTASGKSIHDIRNVGSHEWGTDIDRLSRAITSEKMALTGKNFFSITPSLILGIFGTVVTYEIYMLDETDRPAPELCDFEF